MLQMKSAPIGKEKKEVRFTPSSNTGCMLDEIRVYPDWLRLSFLVGKFTRDPLRLGRGLFILLIRQGVLIDQPSGWSCSCVEAGQNGFEFGVYIRFQDQIRASLQWGGRAQRGRIQLEIRGALCALLQRRQYISLSRAAGRYGGRLGHIDYAADDLLGKYFSPDLIRKKFKADPAAFVPVHRLGKGFHRLSEEWYESPTGKTLYLGSRGATTRTRVYEKGRQLHDTYKGRKHPSWCRWEVTLRRANGVELDLALLHPDYWLQYLLGSCGYLAQIWKSKGLRATYMNEKPIEEPLDRAVKVLLSLRNQYGPAISDLRGDLGDEALLDVISRRQMTGPLAELTAYDAPEILARFDAALCGGLRSSDAGAASEEENLDCLF
jgi:DNA relaxase NicK